MTSETIAQLCQNINSINSAYEATPITHGGNGIKLKIQIGADNAPRVFQVAMEQTNITDETTDASTIPLKINRIRLMAVAEENDFWVMNDSSKLGEYSPPTGDNNSYTYSSSELTYELTRRSTIQNFDSGYALDQINQVSGEDSIHNLLYTNSRITFSLPLGRSAAEQIITFLQVSYLGWRTAANNHEDQGVWSGYWDNPEAVATLTERLNDLVKYNNIFDDYHIEPDVFKKCIHGLLSGKHLILTGVPGCGKTKLAHKLARLAGKSSSITCTASPSWSTDELIGRYLPAHQSGALEFNPGYFLSAIEKDINNFLIIDEINRCDLDSCFGELFTVLSGEHPTTLPYEVVDATEVEGEKDTFMPVVVGRLQDGAHSKKTGEYFFGEDFRIIGTMNTNDAGRLHDFSEALLRRFIFVEIPLPNEDTAHQIVDRIISQHAKAIKARIYGTNLTPFKDTFKKILSAESSYISPATILDILKYFIASIEENAALRQVNQKSEIQKISKIFLSHLEHRIEPAEWEKIEVTITNITL